MSGQAQQVVGREAETRAFLSRRPFSLTLRVAVSAHVNAAVRFLLLVERKSV